jgi:hypothetical protein
LPGQVSYSFTTFLTGFDGNLYYFNQSNPGTNKIKKLVATPYAVNDYSDDGSLGNMGALGFRTILKIKNKDRIIMLSGSGGHECYEVYNGLANQASAIAYSNFGLESVKFGVSSDDYYYLIGISSGSPQNVLIRINPMDNSAVTLLNGGYDIYKMTVSADEKLTFNALRMSDGAIVLGEMSSSGTVSILDVTLDSEVTVLERIR